MKTPPIFKSGPGHLFLFAQFYIAALLVVGLFMHFRDQGNPMAAVNLAGQVEVVLVVLTVLMYRLEQRNKK